MDPSAQYQQQPVDSQAYDPSQYQAYDPYYAYHAQYQQYNQQQYAAYYSQYYANPYQPQQSQQEPASIHPPGVPIPPQTNHLAGSEQGLGQTHSYYPQPGAGSDQTVVQGQQWQNQGGYGAVPAQGGPRPPIGHSAYRGGGGRRGGRPHRGGSRGHFGSRPDGSGGPHSQGGRGRGRGRGRGPHHAATAPGQPPAQGQWPPPRMAWCELCRVDCNTHEILEQHRNGKRHKKNLQVYEELQKLNKIIVEGQKEPEPSGGPVEGSDPEKAPDEVGSAGALGRGTKRKMKVGRGGKRLRRTAEEAPGPKEVVVPLICELCNVKCDSKVVFDAHLAGKKHVLNMKRFQGDQNLLGQAALQALYPALEALYPALQALLPNATNAAGPSSFSLQVHGPQDYGGPVGPVAATLASALPVLEAGGEGSEIEGGGAQKDGIEEGGDQQEPVKVELESEQTVSVDDTDKGNGEMGKEESVDLPVDGSVVVAPPPENKGTEA